mgnify:CR=1 FL=1
MISGYLDIVKEIFDFAASHRIFCCVIFVLNFAALSSAAEKIILRFNRHILEASAGRCGERSLYGRCVSFAKHAVDSCAKNGKVSGFYGRIKDRMKKSGYEGEYAAALYLLLKYIVPPVVFATLLAVKFPDIAGPFVLSLSLFAIVEAVAAMEKKKHNMKLQRCIYKVYKYLHNQISSGVKVTDAVKTMHEAADDREIKNIMIRIAAVYELTMDMDSALGELKSSFDSQEVETLCTALKQGVLTGDSGELLERQENVMFNRYFNHIQAETDGCRIKSAIAAAVFAAIVVIMIAVPMLNEIGEAAGKIFVN